MLGEGRTEAGGKAPQNPLLYHPPPAGPSPPRAQHRTHGTTETPSPGRFRFRFPACGVPGPHPPPRGGRGCGGPPPARVGGGGSASPGTATSPRGGEGRERRAAAPTRDSSLPRQEPDARTYPLSCARLFLLPETGRTEVERMAGISANGRPARHESWPGGSQEMTLIEQLGLRGRGDKRCPAPTSLPRGLVKPASTRSHCVGVIELGGSV